MMPETRASDPLDHALERIGDRWSLLIVAALLDRPLRFKELLASVPRIAPNILIARLRRLERDGLVVAEPYSTRPARFVYRLTAAGGELASALRVLAAWGARRSGRRGLRHGVCGTPLEARWYCATCARVAEGAEAADEETLGA